MVAILQASLLAAFFGSLVCGTGDADSCTTHCSTLGSNLLQVKSEVGKSTAALLQTRALAAKSASLAGVTRAAQLAESNREEPSNIAQAIQKGLEGIQVSIVFFEQDPPDVAGGISALGTRLLDCIGFVITEEGQDAWPDWDEFRNSWTSTFAGLTTSLAEVKQHIDGFATTGEVEDLITALSLIFSHVSDEVLDQLPGDLATEISNYLESLNKALEGLGEAMRAFDAGDTLGGIEQIYFGLRNATESLVPPSLQSDATYSTVVGLLDNIVGDMGEHFHEYKQRVAESKTCWKISQPRSRRAPRLCPSGFRWDGGRHCWPDHAAVCWKMASACVSSFVYNGDTYHNCTGVHHNTHWCSHNAKYRRRQWSTCQQVPCDGALSLVSSGLDRAVSEKAPTGTLPARCDDSDGSGFPEKHGGWCYANCADGHDAFGAKCWTRCRGAFSADSSLICGQDPKVLAATVTEMVIVTARSVFTLATALTSMQTAGVNADSLSSTINIFINMGKPFALPKCSEVDM
jgi:hypothetical protein